MIPGSVLAITLHVGGDARVDGRRRALVYDHRRRGPEVGVDQPRRGVGGAFVLAGVLTLFT